MMFNAENSYATLGISSLGVPAYFFISLEAVHVPSFLLDLDDSIHSTYVVVCF